MSDLGIDARYPRPEALHLTLKFLGDIEESQVPLIGEVLEGVAQRSRQFNLSIEGLGVFPHLSNPSVVWTGIQCEGPFLLQLQQSMDAGLLGLGFPKEGRAFRPHLTLARVRSRRKIALLMDFVERSGAQVDLGSFVAAEFHLFRSILRPEGAQYHRLQSFELSIPGR
jgi:2'-5' RNA ligase